MYCSAISSVMVARMFVSTVVVFSFVTFWCVFISHMCQQYNFNPPSDQGYCVDEHFPTFLLVLSYESFNIAHLKAESEILIPKKAKLPLVYGNV